MDITNITGTAEFPVNVGGCISTIQPGTNCTIQVSFTPAGTLGTNEEVADTILFLCSHAARYIHGQTIEINGGMFMV